MQRNSTLNFLNISIEECGHLSLIVIKNAETHFRCAKVLANANEYANGTAHLILGAEELVKGLILLMEGKGFRLREINNYKKFFSDHKVRHSISKEFFSVFIFLKSIFKIDRKRKNENIVLYFLKAFADIAEGALSGYNHYEWWDKADQLKQMCFYVDYQNTVINPCSISQDQYNEALQHATDFKNDIRLIITALKKANEIELKQLIQNFNEANFKELIGGTIERSSGKRNKNKDVAN